MKEDNSVVVEEDVMVQAMSYVSKDVPRAETLSQKKAALEQEIKSLEARLSDLLGIEDQARSLINEKIGGLKREMINLKLAPKYPSLSLEVLKWRNEQGYPKLALFNLKNSIFSISSSGNNWDIPGQVKNECYKDVIERLRNSALQQKRLRSGLAGVIVGVAAGVLAFFVGSVMIAAFACPLAGTAAFGIALLCVAEKEYILKARYCGLIPDKVRTEIKEAQANKDFEDVFIITEIKQWSLEKVAVPLICPLVVGFAEGQLFLIDKYDTTYLENYIGSEFAV